MQACSIDGSAWHLKEREESQVECGAFDVTDAHGVIRIQNFSPKEHSKNLCQKCLLKLGGPFGKKTRLVVADFKARSDLK